MGPLVVAGLLLAATGESDPTAESLLARHQAYLDRIQTLEVRIESWASRDGGRTWSRQEECEWLKSGSRERYRQAAKGYVDLGGTYREHATWSDAAYQPGETRELHGWNPGAVFRDEPSAANQYHGASAVIAGTTAADSVSSGPPFLMMLSATMFSYLPQFYRTAARAQAPRLVEMDGARLWAFQAEDAHYPHPPRFTIYIDPARSYAIVRREAEFNPPGAASVPIRAVHEVVEFAEPEPGLFLPTRVRMKDLSKPDELSEYRIRLVSVNRPIDEARLRLDFPPGMKVRDLKEGSVHIWGNGAPRLTFQDEAQLRAHEASIVTRSRSRSNPAAWLTALAVLPLLLLLWYVRRRWIARMAA